MARQLAATGNWDWRRHWPRLFLAVLALLVIVQAVRLLWLFLVPTGPFGEWRSAAAQTLSPAEARALFGGLDPFFRSAAAGVGSDAVTALDLKLYGLNVNEASGSGSAIIAGSDGVQVSYAVGEEVLPGVTLAAVNFDHVVLDRGGVRESLFIDQSVPADTANVAQTAPSSSAAAVPAPSIGSELSPAALQAGVAFAPRTESGKVTGITVQPQGDGAAFRAAGLRPGDVIRGINGRPVSGAADIAGQLTPGARLSLEVERGSAVVPVAIFVGKP